jgi:hypothetical protein
MFVLILATVLGHVATDTALPPVSYSDLERFPPPGTVMASRSLALAHLEWLERCMSLGESEALRLSAWRAEAAELYAAWDALADAQMACSPESALWHLEVLRDLLGPEAYYCYPARMPPPVPLWQFEIP